MNKDDWRDFFENKGYYLRCLVEPEEKLQHFHGLPGNWIGRDVWEQLYETKLREAKTRWEKLVWFYLVSPGQ